jgi:hypothetical protein
LPGWPTTDITWGRGTDFSCQLNGAEIYSSKRKENKEKEKSCKLVAGWKIGNQDTWKNWFYARKSVSLKDTIKAAPPLPRPFP